MKLSQILIFSLVVAMLLLGGCADDPPNPVGSQLIPHNDRVKIFSYDTTAVYDSTYLLPLPGNTTLVMLGKYQDNESRSLLQFYIDSTIFAKTKIDSATLSFHISYKFKDSVGTLGFTIHNMRVSWSQGTFTWDSLTAGSYSDTILGTYTATIYPGDSTLSIRLDTADVHAWIHNGQGSMILVPTAASTMIVGFESISSSADLNPKLSITYHDTANTSFVDSMYSYQRSYIAHTTMPANPQHFFAQGGIAIRGRLKFDVSGIPANSSITEANLHLSFDSTLSIRGYSALNTLLAQIALNDSIKPLIGGYYGTSTMPNSSSFTVPITSVVQQWVTTKHNYGLVVDFSNEYTMFDRYALFDNTAAPALRPKLTIKYSVVQ